MSDFFFWGEEGSKMTPKNRTLEGKNGPKNQTSFMDVPYCKRTFKIERVLSDDLTQACLEKRNCNALLAIYISRLFTLEWKRKLRFFWRKPFKRLLLILLAYKLINYISTSFHVSWNRKFLDFSTALLFLWDIFPSFKCI